MTNDYTIDVFGRYNQVEIRGIIDSQGKHWFTQEELAGALGLDRTTVAKLRENYPAEFSEFIDYSSLVFEGKRRTVYSEEGFMTVCDMAKSEEAYRLRKWMRQQFRVRREGEDIVIRARGLPREDLSDLGSDLVLLQGMIDALAEDRRRIKVLEREQAALASEATEVKERIVDSETRIAILEGHSKIRPGEMTAIQLAMHCGWCSKAGGAHNPAVVLAAINEDFLARGLMHPRSESDANGRPVETHVFTVEGVSEFVSKIDSPFRAGQTFTIEPNAIARQLGKKNSRYVFKK